VVSKSCALYIYDMLVFTPSLVFREPSVSKYVSTRQKSLTLAMVRTEKEKVTHQGEGHLDRQNLLTVCFQVYTSFNL